MNLDEVLAIFDDTYANEWHRVHPVEPFEENGHYYRIVYKPDVALAVEWGRTVNEDFVDDWTEIFSDKSASSHVAEIMLNGEAVHQEFYVNVDGGRCSLPLPERHFKSEDILEPSSSEVDHYSVTTWAVNFMRLLDDVNERGEFDDYLRRSGFQIVG